MGQAVPVVTDAGYGRDSMQDFRCCQQEGMGCEMKRIFIVTGAGGLLGSSIVRRLAGNSENEIRALLLPGEPDRAIADCGCRIYRGDVTDSDSLADIFDVCDGSSVFVIHCAGIVTIKSGYDPAVRAVNVEGTANVAEKALGAGARFVYISSVHAIRENPEGGDISETCEFDPDDVIGAYAKSKAEASGYIMDMVRSRGLDACILHPAGIIGPGDPGSGHMNEFVRKVAGGKLPLLPKGGYSFVDVRDVAECAVNACFKARRGECYIVSGGYFTIRELADIICEMNHRRKIRAEVPVWLIRPFVPAAELYYRLRRQTPLFTGYSLYTISSEGRFSSAKAERELGFSPRDIRETLRDATADPDLCRIRDMD